MFLKVINTGSQGNGYAIGNENEVLLIEAGCRFIDVKKALNFRVDNIVGMVISHEHGDHFKYAQEYKKSWIRIFCPFQEDKKSVQFGGFKVQTFDNPHGEIISYGFIILHDEIGRLCFVTDAEYVKYDFSALKVNHILVECNWQDGMVDYDSPNFKHKVTGHMSLQTCKDFIKHNASNELHNVVLIHWSEATIDLDHAVEEVKSVCDVDVNVVIAEPGLEIKLNKEWLDD